MFNNRKLQFLLERKLSTDEKVPRTGRILRNKIFVIGFPPNCTEIDLEKFFSNFGLVREARIVRDDNGITKGYAFITFAKERSVVYALEYRCPLYFMDRKLSINPAVKKHQQFIQSERCIDTSSDIISNSSSKSNDYHRIISSEYYYNSPHTSYFQFGLPSYPTYYSSESIPSMWSHYYPGCSFVPMFNNNNNMSSNISIYSRINGDINCNSMGMLQNVYFYGNQ